MARPSPFRSRSPRRRTSWESGPLLSQVNLSASGAVAWGTGSQALEDGLTLVRTRGHGLISISSLAAVTDGMRGAVGIAIASENAFGAGVSSLMNPNDDDAWDGWLWHSFFSVSTIIGEGAGVQKFVVDSKAMRKFNETDVIYGIIDVAAETGTVAINLNFQTRLLVKLS